MIDETTHQRLYVSTDGTAGPYVMVPLAQLPRVMALLKRNEIRHWADQTAISLDGTPMIAVVNLGRGGDAQVVQKLLDEA